EPPGVEGRRAEEDRDDPVGGGCERAGDDFCRAAVAAHGVDGNRDGHRSGERVMPPAEQSPAPAANGKDITARNLSPSDPTGREGRYGIGEPSGSTSRPLYVLQFGQTRWGRFGCPQVGQMLTRGDSMPCCARRLSRRDFDVFFFGTAMRPGSIAAATG